MNSVLLMADIVVYGSSQIEQGFPPLIIRAMSYGIPLIAPDFPIVKKYVRLLKFCLSNFQFYKIY